MAGGLHGLLALAVMGGTLALTTYGLLWWQGLLTAAVVASLFVHLDVLYFVRTLSLFIGHALNTAPPCDLFETVNLPGRLWLTDLDWNLHMNNARYPRECDIARYNLWKHNGVFDALKKLGGFMVLGACTTRFRRSIEPFQAYDLTSQVLCWDESAFYVEQRFVTKDGFVRAIFFAKQAIVKTTTHDVLKELGFKDTTSPAPPKHLVDWMAFDKECRRVLRVEAKLE
ncbi:hypothetical protein PTSG_03769 [Salpingoeca rosetta]|uniref:Thioesterase n=1 Tax=Salpingoeca rosetta (strain ATCC 50818 / BSB-021) TaxID=946362 RepID=F2U5B7_SALR5|nr:uncharacterized protein PTSG_03769 [Salpingoeca rosetta]EGD83133.1 hypothetical protein PTSG_03769 [Salpingoeca rosetta]|eukprot:XP_004995497.1 hypothetical protein PTSG_03769 [Salpingoeca rosetta]